MFTGQVATRIVQSNYAGLVAEYTLEIIFKGINYTNPSFHYAVTLCLMNYNNDNIIFKC